MQHTVRQCKACNTCSIQHKAQKHKAHHTLDRQREISCSFSASQRCHNSDLVLPQWRARNKRLQLISSCEKRTKLLCDKIEHLTSLNTLQFIDGRMAIACLSKSEAWCHRLCWSPVKSRGDEREREIIIKIEHFNSRTRFPTTNVVPPLRCANALVHSAHRVNPPLTWLS